LVLLSIGTGLSVNGIGWGLGIAIWELSRGMDVGRRGVGVYSSRPVSEGKMKDAEGLVLCMAAIGSTEIGWVDRVRMLRKILRSRKTC